MEFLRRLFGKCDQPPEKGGLSVSDYIKTHRPGTDPLLELSEIVRSWMNSLPQLSAEGQLGAFMDSFARDWHVSWQRGSRDQVLGWFKDCATPDIGTQPRAHHSVIGLDVPCQKRGTIVLETVPRFWESHGVTGSVIQMGVSGAHHVIGRASALEFFYLVRCGPNNARYRDRLQNGDWLEFRCFCETSCLSPILLLPNLTLHNRRRTTLAYR